MEQHSSRASLERGLKGLSGLRIEGPIENARELFKAYCGLDTDEKILARATKIQQDALKVFLLLSPHPRSFLFITLASGSYVHSLKVIPLSLHQRVSLSHSTSDAPPCLCQPQRAHQRGEERSFDSAPQAYGLSMPFN